MAYDSRQVRPGELFVAIRGYHADGHGFIEKAIEKGAAAVAAEKFTGHEAKAATILVPDSETTNLPLRYMALSRHISASRGPTTDPTTYLLESMMRLLAENQSAQ
jgi:UDP-N-acetylmuramyl tripeptide synthase